MISIMSDIVDQSMVFRVFAGDAELSPFHDCYANSDTILRNCAGRLFPHFNGEDVLSSYTALKEKAVLFDVPEKPIEVSGSDVVAFLDKIFTRDISSLRINRGKYVLACTSSGGLFMDAIVFRISHDRFWIVQPDGNLHTWLEAHKGNFDITICDPNSRVLQLQGPKSFDIISLASKGVINDKFGYFHSAFVEIGNQTLFVSRSGWTGELGYEIYTLGKETNAAQLWDKLMQIGSSYGLKFSSMQAMNIRRIEAGILDSGSDFNDEMNPYEAGLGKFVDNKKVDFIGRNALSRVTKKKKLYGILSEKLLPSRGFSITNRKGIAIGAITSGVFSPYFSAGIGYVKCFSGIDDINQKFTMTSFSGEKDDCQVLDLPFYDKEKLIPRTLR